MEPVSPVGMEKGREKKGEGIGVCSGEVLQEEEKEEEEEELSAGVSEDEDKVEKAWEKAEGVKVGESLRTTRNLGDPRKNQDKIFHPDPRSWVTKDLVLVLGIGKNSE